jgi:D-serine deaminase-like pyridoxal phosphate-dependent protein
MDWYRLTNEAEISSPSLILYSERIEKNLLAMVAVAKDPVRLWPHVKTHKVAELIAQQVALGICKFKCATIAEAEMVSAVSGVTRLLLAVQPVGPQLQRLLQLCQRYPHIRFATIVDDLSVVLDLATLFRSATQTLPSRHQIEVFLDLNVGQGRTGIQPDATAVTLALAIEECPSLKFTGLHAYDGHLGLPDLAERSIQCDLAFQAVDQLRHSLETRFKRELDVIVAGSPTFALHAARARVYLSPGTTVFWDAGYATKFPDLPFQPAAALLCRVISRPAQNHLCLDLGHKAVASEMPQPRVLFPDLPDATFLSHSEEHLLIASSSAHRLPVGSVLYAIPWHVCPTVALHSQLWIARNQLAIDQWKVLARARCLTI